MRVTGLMAVALALSTYQLSAQWWDFPAQIAGEATQPSEGKWKIGLDVRVRYETRTGTAFGKDPDITTGLERTRVSMSYQPESWLKFGAMMQDTRAPWYGANAPNNVRDPADLQEGYFEIRPEAPTGFGMTAGRQMLSLGEGRVIGGSVWSNNSKTYDQIRAHYSFPWARFEFLVVSPVKIRIGEFNRPVLGDREWGMYNVFPEIFGSQNLEVYALRRDQNRPGGFTGGSSALGTDQLHVNTFGGRLFGPIGTQWTYNLELSLENGKTGAASQGAGAFDAWLKRRWQVAKKPFDLMGEYKYATGTKNPDATHSNTYDQGYATHHDRFGHEDLFGLRNTNTARVLATYSLTKAFALNVMYDSFWLAQARDGVYGSTGKLLARSADGSAGKHVGEEIDVFATYKYKHFLVGSGYGNLRAGHFLKQTTPGIGPTYLYFFHDYAF